MFYLENFSLISWRQTGFRMSNYLCLGAKKTSGRSCFMPSVSLHCASSSGVSGGLRQGPLQGGPDHRVGERYTHRVVSFKRLGYASESQSVSVAAGRGGDIYIYFFFSGEFVFEKNKIYIYRRKINRPPQSKQIEKPFFFCKS